MTAIRPPTINKHSASTDYISCSFSYNEDYKHHEERNLFLKEQYGISASFPDLSAFGGHANVHGFIVAVLDQHNQGKKWLPIDTSFYTYAEKALQITQEFDAKVDSELKRYEERINECKNQLEQKETSEQSSEGKENQTLHKALNTFDDIQNELALLQNRKGLYVAESTNRAALIKKNNLTLIKVINDKNQQLFPLNQKLQELAKKYPLELQINPNDQSALLESDNLEEIITLNKKLIVQNEKILLHLSWYSSGVMNDYASAQGKKMVLDIVANEVLEFGEFLNAQRSPKQSATTGLLSEQESTPFIVICPESTTLEELRKNETNLDHLIKKTKLITKNNNFVVSLFKTIKEYFIQIWQKIENFLESPTTDPIVKQTIGLVNDEREERYILALVHDFRNKENPLQSIIKYDENYIDKKTKIQLISFFGRHYPEESNIKTALVNNGGWLNDVEIVQLLLDLGADINAVNERGQNPLHLAANYGYTDVVKLLIAAGTAINAKDKQGKTPLDVAYSQEIEQLLSQDVAIVKKTTKLSESRYSSWKPLVSTDKKDELAQTDALALK